MPKRKRRDDKSRVSGSAGPETGEPFNAAFAGLAALRPPEEEPPPEPAPLEAAEVAPEAPRDPSLGRRKIIVRKEKKGRGGKTVTRVEGLDADPGALGGFARRLAKELGCGAKVEEDVILAQGDQGERVADWLRRQGATRVVMGDTQAKG